MQSNMLHYASVLLIIVVWMTKNTVGMQKLDRQEECSDRFGCRVATMGDGCNNPIISARCPKTCGTCAGEEAATTTTTTTTTAEPTTALRKLVALFLDNVSCQMSHSSKDNTSKTVSRIKDYNNFL